MTNDQREQNRDLGLAECTQVVEANNINLFLWRGDAIQDGLAALLNRRGLKAENHGLCVEVGPTSVPRLAAAPCPPPDQVLNRQAIGNPEKWDWVLPDRLFHASYASSRLDLAGAHAWCVGWEG